MVLNSYYIFIKHNLIKSNYKSDIKYIELIEIKIYTELINEGLLKLYKVLVIFYKCVVK